MLAQHISPTKFNNRRHIYTAFVFNVRKPLNFKPLLDYLHKHHIKDIIVEPKYDGLYVQITKNMNDVHIYSDQGSDLTQNVDMGIVNAIKKLPIKSLVAEGELELYINGKHEPRGLMVGLIHRKNSTLPSYIHEVITLFDLLFLNGVDYSYQNTLERLEKLNSLKLPQLLNPKDVFLNSVPYWRVKSNTALKTIAKKICKITHFEGIIIKPTNVNAHNLRFIKFKKYIEFALEVIKKTPTKTKGVFNYDLAAYDNGQLVKVARSYNSALNLDIGDHVTVAAFNVSCYIKNDKVIRVHLYAPKIQNKTLAPINTIKTILETAENYGVLEKHRTIAKPVPPP